MVLSALLSCNSTKCLSNGSDKEVFSTPDLKIKHLTPIETHELDSKINEGSGLLAWNGYLWTHNDSGAPVLYALDTVTGRITKQYVLPGKKNQDWEDLSQDEQHLYIGAVGNNRNEKDSLKIYIVNKSELLRNRIVMDSITFVWPEIISRGKSRKINFDCEAMAVIEGRIYLFTKEWKKQQCTKVFTLPKNPGNYTAKYETTFETKILITGASYNSGNRKLVLCGYNMLGRPCLFVFPYFRTQDVFGKQGLKINVKHLAFHQVEGITTFDGEHYYLINEQVRFLFLNKMQQINKVILKD
jgi:hypothetical protein